MEAITRFNSVDHLKTEDDQRRYLAACLEEGGDDPAFIAFALGQVARARGMSDVSRQIGMGRQALYRALSREGNPSFHTVMKVAGVLGLKLRFDVPAAKRRRRTKVPRARPPRARAA